MNYYFAKVCHGNAATRTCWPCIFSSVDSLHKSTKLYTFKVLNSEGEGFEQLALTLISGVKANDFKP